MNHSTVKPALNPTQLLLLKTFASVDSEEEMQEIQALLLNYYQKKVDARANKLWDDLNLSNDKIEELLHTHYRTPYK
jgi:cyanate lyase